MAATLGPETGRWINIRLVELERRSCWPLFPFSLLFLLSPSANWRGGHVFLGFGLFICLSCDWHLPYWLLGPCYGSLGRSWEETEALVLLCLCFLYDSQKIEGSPLAPPCEEVLRERERERESLTTVVSQGLTPGLTKTFSIHPETVSYQSNCNSEERFENVKPTFD